MPGMGVATIFRNPKCGMLRRWRVRGFADFLIFYRPLDDGIEVVRVLHGARETEKLFE
jgi:toxin ParE1/3/4